MYICAIITSSSSFLFPRERRLIPVSVLLVQMALPLTCVQLPMTEVHSYQLSTAEDELGVVIADSEAGENNGASLFERSRMGPLLGVTKNGH